MRCNSCSDKEAIMHFTQIVDNEVTTYHLCESCAAEKGLEPGLAAGDQPLTDLMAQLSEVGRDEREVDDGTCGYCGLELDDFKKSGRLGCSHCYVTFEDHLRRLLRRLHGSTDHVGKVYLPPDPTEAQRRERLAGLKRRLDRAVDREDFERAAVLRDQIRELEAAQG